MTRSHFAAIGAAATLMVVVAGCTPGGGSTPGATPIVTVTAPTPTLTPSATPTFTAPPGHTYVFGDEWTTSPASQPQGSGCAPGVGLLLDGVWFGFASSWSTTQIAFDLACWYTGAEAEAQATARGEEAYDYYITNDNNTVRLVTVAGDIPAMKADGFDTGVVNTLTQVMADPGGSLPVNSPYLVWIYVNGGQVTELAVQYVP